MNMQFLGDSSVAIAEGAQRRLPLRGDRGARRRLTRATAIRTTCCKWSCPTRRGFSPSVLSCAASAAWMHGHCAGCIFRCQIEKHAVTEQSAKARSRLGSAEVRSSNALTKSFSIFSKFAYEFDCLYAASKLTEVWAPANDSTHVTCTFRGVESFRRCCWELEFDWRAFQNNTRS